MTSSRIGSRSATCGPTGRSLGLHRGRSSATTTGRCSTPSRNIENITGRRDAQRLARGGGGALPARLRRRADRHGARRPRRELARTNAKLCQILGYEEAGLARAEIPRPDAPRRRLEASNDGCAASSPGVSLVHPREAVPAPGRHHGVGHVVGLARPRRGRSAPLLVAQIENIDDRKRDEVEAGRSLRREREHVEQLRALDAMKDEFVALGVARAAHAADLDQGLPRARARRRVEAR